MSHAPPGRLAAQAVLVLALLVLPQVALAQSGFMFWRPVATVSLLGGWSMPGEGSDLFDFTREELTVGEGDFASPAVGIEVALRASEQFDVALGLERASRTVDSEMREWVTQDDQPILQSTQFERIRLLGTVRGYLFPRGRQISEFAWVPYRWSPYLGVGGGVSWYEFVQSGDFVDFRTLDIFEDEFEERGHGWTVHGAVGAQLSVSTRFLLRGEYRYILGDGDLSQETFEGFQDVDLSSSTFLVGIAVRL